MENESSEPSKCKDQEIKVKDFCKNNCLLENLNFEGLLWHYRGFVQNFLKEIKNKEHNGKHTTHFHIEIRLSEYELSKLDQFATSQDSVKVSGRVQDVTEILINMFSHVEYFEPHEFAENMSKVVLSIAMDPRIQIALYLVIVAVVLSSWLLRQIYRHGFSVRSLIITLLVLVFVISVVNNHFLLTQVLLYLFKKSNAN